MIPISLENEYLPTIETARLIFNEYWIRVLDLFSMHLYRQAERAKVCECKKDMVSDNMK